MVIYSYSHKDIYHQDVRLTIQLVLIFKSARDLPSLKCQNHEAGIFHRHNQLHVPPHLLGNLLITTGPSFSEAPKTRTYTRGTKK